MIRLRQDELYLTSDIALAAGISLWYPLEAVDWTENPHKAKFLFKRDERLDQLVASYWHGELQVNPQAYFNALKMLKARLYETK